MAGPYWDSKRAAMDKIKIPTFIKGTDSASMHTMGSIRAWMQIPSEHKWIKWNAYQEWFDLVGVLLGGDDFSTALLVVF